MSNILKYIILLTLLSLSLYPAEKSDINKLKKITVATIDLDNHFKINKDLRKEAVRTINRYHYLKQKRTIVVDREKKKLLGTNELNIEEGLTIASNLNVRIAILVDSERILITNENTNVRRNTLSNNPKEYRFSNNYKIVFDSASNNIFTNRTSGTNLSLTNNLISENESEEERYEFRYNFNVVDIETDNILKEYKSISSNQAISTIQGISEYLEAYLSKMIFDSFEERNNNIELNFEIEKVSSDNRTNSISSRGEVTEGDSISFKFSPNRDGYLYIFALQNNGNMILMHPNDFNNFVNTGNIQKDEIEAGKNYIIPPEDSKFRIVVSPLPIDENSEIENIDSFYAVYMRRNQKWIVGQYFSGDGFKMVSRNRTTEFTFKLKKALKLKYEWQIEKIYLNVVSKLKDK
ncbi:DUF4384 domain-containing protein [Brachyspira catarrhinii]|uniref:DUF4384 domain-containing protein n=1 Tax=Brachyspira catarrhinii TaxID=2528966 RepID=A0ABY2TUJ1_9SPIR|nr:DUF4384 domain-containing protein [Brachyspira catarrhinii]